MVGLLGDEGFVDALKNAENLVGDVEETLRRVEEVEDEANQGPDSGKVGVYAGSPPGGEEERDVSGYYDPDATVDYWDGEE
jgi:hypothetical protein